MPIWSICQQKAVDLAHAGDDAKEVVFLDVDFKQSQCLLDGEPLAASDFAFDHYQIIQESIKRIQGRLDWNPTFLYLLEEPFTVYEATELVNLINPGRPIVSNNFLVKFGDSWKKWVSSGYLRKNHARLSPETVDRAGFILPALPYL